MARPPKPVDSYPAVAPGEMPPLPPVDPPGEAVATASAGDAPAPPDAARLTFRGDRPVSEEVALDFPFEWEGAVVAAVTVRRLTVAEVAAVVESVEFERDGLWAVYAAQCALPAAVLRGMIEDDGVRVLGACRRFLPRSFAQTLADFAAGSASSPIPDSGAASPPR